MGRFDLSVDVSWSHKPENIQRLAQLLKANVSEQDCAVIFGTTVESIALVVRENATARGALIEALDNQRYVVKRSAVSRAENVLQTMYDINQDPDEKAGDRIAAGKVVLDAAGMIGASAQATEKRMTREESEAAAADTRAQDTLNNLINHLIDARQKEIDT